MRRPRIPSALLVATAALLAVPLRSDGGPACDNATTSLTSTLNSPVSGDEKFFTLPSGPSNVMFMLDSSGSMSNIPQCGDSQFSSNPSYPNGSGPGTACSTPPCNGDFVWGAPNARPTCQWPTWGTPATPAAPATSNVYPPSVAAGNITFTTNGSCNAVGTGSNATLGTFLGANYTWMAGYAQTSTLVDPGHGTASNGLVDSPTWGTGCTGNACLFQPTAIYNYYAPYYGNLGTASGWNENSAKPVWSSTASNCQIATINVSALGSNVYNCSGGAPGVKMTSGTIPVIDPLCKTCTGTTAPGFYFFNNWSAKVKFYTNSACSSTSTVTFGPSTSGVNTALATPAAIFTGGWLNADPPKFMSARKVIKNVAWVDPGVSSSTDQLRLGLGVVTSAVTNNAAIVVPLGPSQADSYPTNPSAFVAARQLLLNALNKQSVPSGVTLPALAYGATPMATGLFHLGQHFTTPGTYTSAFGSTWELPEFAPSYAGLMQAPWVDSSTSGVCWKCQQSAVIIVTDGSPNSEAALPATITGYDQSIYQNVANCGANATDNCNHGSSNSLCCSTSDAAANPPSALPRVAAYWYDSPAHDLSTTLPGVQHLTVSTVSVNLPAGNAQTILQSTANMGNGLYNNAADGTALADAVNNAVSGISSTTTSFGAPAAATALTTINAVDTKAFLTRFKPNTKPTWEGHLFEWMLFDKTAAGCDPTKKTSDPPQLVQCRGKTVNANLDGEATPAGYNNCSGSFLVDADCDQVIEDQATGYWFKKGTGGAATSTPAKKFWDAGEVLSNATVPAMKTSIADGTGGATAASGALSPGTAMPGYRTAAEPDTAVTSGTANIAPAGKYAPGKTPRNLWTVLPGSATLPSGATLAAGTMIELETGNAALLAPYMNLDQAWCSSMESLAKLCGASPLPSCPVTNGTNWQTYCAQQVILFARGWDVMDADGDGCGSPGFGTSYASYSGMTQPNPANGTASNSNKLMGTYSTSTTPTVTANYGSCVLSAVGAVNYTGEERNRPNDGNAIDDLAQTQSPSFFKLGDIFHSSPVLVHPPTGEALCRLGADNQCVKTLFGYSSNAKYTTGYQTSLGSNSITCGSTTTAVDAYRAWRNDNRNRENVVLVGSNDGFLHAVDAGGPDTTGQADQDCVMPNVKDGPGTELWAVLPPDLLPRLRDTMTDHQYMVDGDIKVRDVWQDGVAADPSTTNNPSPGTGNAFDGVKQKNEFRTVVVFGERTGGTQFTGLDVTEAFSTTASDRPRPTFLWSFPPPRSDDAQYMAESWSDSSPRPPPIGPVRLRALTGDRATGSWTPPGATGAEQFVEKWVVMLNGGYDPTLNRGRAVWMVDAWTGQVYWRFTDSDFKTNVVANESGASLTGVSMFPVAAGIGMVDLGDPTASSGLDSDNFFDTATWGDVGGNLFVARFDRPGVRGSDGRVTNWRAGRGFEQGRTTNSSQNATNRQEFFYMTSNAWEPQRHKLLTQVGSGNREQILEQGLGCGPDNVLGCCQAGCSASTTSNVNYGVCSSSGGFQCDSSGNMTTTAFSQGCGSSGASACTANATSTFNSSSSYALTCGSSLSSSAGSTICDANGLCTVNPVGTGHDLVPPGASSCGNRAKFYGIWTYGGYGVAQKTMSTDPSLAASNWTSAVTFDENRFTDVANFTKSGVCTFTPSGTCSLVETTYASVDYKGLVDCSLNPSSTTKCTATVEDPGWFYQYNVATAPCPTKAACNTSCTHEKTVSASAVVNSCVSWNSFLPLGSASSATDPCQGATTATQTAVGYSSDYVSGVQSVSCNQGSDQSANVTYRGVQRPTIAPPAAPMPRESVTKGGKVYYSTLQLDPGSSGSTSSSGSRESGAALYWLEVSREGHNCRHASGANCD